MTVPRNALAHAVRPARGAVARVRAPWLSYPRAAAAAPQTFGLDYGDRNVEPVEQM
jgi:hypothetical protein